MDSRRLTLDVGEDASEVGVLWFGGLGISTEKYCEPSMLTF